MFALFLIFAIILLISWPKRKHIKPECKYHEWYYRFEGTDHEYMVCKKCQKLPGTSMTEEKPY